MLGIPALVGLLGLAVGYIAGHIVAERYWLKQVAELWERIPLAVAPPPRPPAREAESPPPLMWGDDGPMLAAEPEDKREQRKKEREERTFWS